MNSNSKAGRKLAEQFVAKVNSAAQRLSQTAESAGAQSLPDVPTQLEKLGALRDSGVLTEEEFQAKKAELLARM
jgi:Short C-terminal domain